VEREEPGDSGRSQEDPTCAVRLQQLGQRPPLGRQLAGEHRLQRTVPRLHLHQRRVWTNGSTRFIGCSEDCTDKMNLSDVICIKY